MYDGLLSNFDTVTIEKYLVAHFRAKSLSAVQQYAA
jgi:hypothetical protein